MRGKARGERGGEAKGKSWEAGRGKGRRCEEGEKGDSSRWREIGESEKKKVKKITNRKQIHIDICI